MSRSSVKRNPVLLSLLLSWAVLVGLLSSSCGLPEPRPAQNTPTSRPEAHWTLVGEEKAGDWLVYEAGANIKDILPDGDTIWAASCGGLLRWDRRSGDVQQYISAYTPLPGDDVRDLLFYQGKLYITTADGVAVLDEQERWTVYSSDTISPGIKLNSAAMVGGVLWVGSRDGIAQLFPDGHWERIQAGPDTFPERDVWSISVRDDGVYVHVFPPVPHGLEGQVARFSQGRWETMPIPWPDYVVAPGGIWWKGKEDKLLWSKDQGRHWQTIVSGYDSVYVKEVDSQGRVYFTDYDSVLILEGNRVAERYSFADVGPMAGYIEAIRSDSSGRTWFIDFYGLGMFDGRRWHYRPLHPDGLGQAELAVAGNTVYMVTWNAAGVTRVEIYDFEHDRRTAFRPEQKGLGDVEMDCLAVDAQGRAYLPSRDGVLHIYSAGEWQHVPSKLAEEGYGVGSAGLVDAAGAYWLGTWGGGLWRYDGSGWTGYDTANGSLPSNRVTALAQDADGRLWVGTGGGLAVRDTDGRWYAYTPDRFPLEDSDIYDLAIDGGGRVWIRQEDNLVVFNGREWATVQPVLAGGYMVGLSADGQRRIWVASTYGLSVFRGQVEMDPFVKLENPPVITPLPASTPLPTGTPSANTLASVRGTVTTIAWIAIGAGFLVIVGVVALIALLLRRSNSQN